MTPLTDREREMPKRVTADALEMAATWCDSYEAAPDDQDVADDLAAVAAWLRREAARRRETNAARRVAAEHRAPVSMARAAIRAAIARATEGKV